MRENNKADSQEDDVVVENEASSESAVAKLKANLKECEHLKKEYLQGWQREKADAQNQKKLHMQRLEEERERALATYTLHILPIIDSLKMALGGCADDTTMRSGIEQVYNQCLQSLADINITLIDPVGEPFDPQEHEAVGEQAVEDKSQNGKVLSVARVGAKVGPNLVRAALVTVGTYTA